MDAKQELDAKVKELEATYGKDNVQEATGIKSEGQHVEIVGKRWLIISDPDSVLNLDHVKEIEVQNAKHESERKAGKARLAIKMRDCTQHCTDWCCWTISRERAEKIYRQVIEALRAVDKVDLLMED